MTKILIAEDHRMVRQGLKRILAEDIPDARFGEAGTAREALALMRQGSWDVMVLDIFMPEGGGWEVLRQVVSSRSPFPVLVLSSAPEEQLALRALQAGAAGYLNKQAASEELIHAVKKVLAGGNYVSARLAEQLAREYAHPSPHAPHESLSEREFQVLQLLAEGKCLKEIAAELSLSPKTVSTFHSRTLEKLRLHNDVELIHYALEHQLSERLSSRAQG
jgi:two-component system, NarL family, invasion response regulator UvrY